jgi:hypothetical protein
MNFISLLLHYLTTQYQLLSLFNVHCDVKIKYNSTPITVGLLSSKTPRIGGPRPYGKFGGGGGG